jgi:hypothetical protein
MRDADRSAPDPELERLLSALPTSIPPPESLERRAWSALRARRPLPRGVIVAAAAVLFACGLGVGRLLPARATPEPTMPGYVLLLYEDGEYRPAPPGAASARVDEYRAWARGIAERGIAIGGERLESTASDRLGGYFVVGATSRAEAEQIARTCPHLRHGGRVVVKAILPT